jgi:hypothetical protein
VRLVVSLGLAAGAPCKVLERDGASFMLPILISLRFAQGTESRSRVKLQVSWSYMADS